MTWHTGLGRDGPGLLLHDIRRRADAVEAAARFLSELDADVMVLMDIDHDLDGLAIATFAGRLGYAHWLAPMPNTGIQAGFDLDRDGRLTEPEDALGFGRFPGAGGVAVVSRWPLRLVADLSTARWAEAASDFWPRNANGAAYFTAAEGAALPLWSVGAFEVALDITNSQTEAITPLTLLAWHAAPPAFDGPEQRNRLRNAAQNASLLPRLDALHDAGQNVGPFILIGDSNLDPARGGGERGVMQTLTTHAAVQDPAPVALHPGLATADAATAWWPDGPGALRVSYILPDRRLRVLDSGLAWMPGATHAAVWVDLDWPP